MATVKYIGESPFEGVEGRHHHESDYKYQTYTENIACDVSSSSSPVRLAIFGLGRAGTIHLSNIIANPRVIVAYIVEADSSKWESVKTKWSLEKTTFLHPDSAEKVYKDPEVDACLISTPTFTHEGFIIGSLEAGKAVFSEKPIAEDPLGTSRCYKKAEEVGRPLFCAFNRRFDPSFSSVRGRVLQGDVGHVQMIKTTSRDSPLPSLDYLKISGGIFHDCAVHDIDLITWILGEYPSKASPRSPVLRSADQKFPAGLHNSQQSHSRDWSHQRPRQRSHLPHLPLRESRLHRPLQVCQLRLRPEAGGLRGEGNVAGEECQPGQHR